MATPVIPATPQPKESWLKRFGHEVGVVLGFIAKQAPAIVNDAAAVATIVMPQFAPLISAADSLATKILGQVQVTEAAFLAAGQANNGQAKLQAVLAAIGPEINTWVANNFPGAKQVSTAAQAGLVNAIVAIANDIDASLAPPQPTQVAVAAAAATQSAVAAAKPA